MNLETQVKLHKELSRKIEELEAEKKALGAEILKQMPNKTLQIAGYLVRHFSRLSIKLSIPEARALNATLMEETIDRKKIKALYEQDGSLQGVSETHFIQVSEV